MSKRIWSWVGPMAGTWFDIPEQSTRVYVPFGKTRLNKIGLFYFRRHHWRRIEQSLNFVQLTASEKSQWMKLPDGLKVFVKRV